MIDHLAQVARFDGAALLNLLAGGGAVCGVSGQDISDYLSGNGLLSAISIGMLAGQTVGRALSSS